MIRGKKILGALLAFTLCFGMVIPAQADDISDAKKKQQELEQQKNTAEAEKSELSSELDSIVSKNGEDTVRSDCKRDGDQ